MEQKEIIQEFRKMRAELQNREGIINSLIYKAARCEKMSAEDFPPIVMQHWIGDCGYFKGKKPLAVIFQDKRRAEVKTWKEVVLLVMQDCEIGFHEQLEYLCGKAYGKQRVLLDEKPDRLQVPLQVGEKIYLEAKFDTESLLRVLTERILYAVGYDYGDIQIECQE